MKKFLFVIFFFLSVFAKAMDFYPLDESELPRVSYKLVLPVSSNTDTVNVTCTQIHIQFHPYAGAPLIHVAGKYPMDLSTFMKSTIKSKTIPTTILNHPKRSLFPEELKKELLNVSIILQIQGIEALFRKNIKLVEWLKCFLPPLQQSGDICEQNFINAAHLFAYGFGGRVEESSEQDTFLEVYIDKKTLKLKRKNLYECYFTYKIDQILDFRAFLQSLGLSIFNGRLLIRLGNN